MSAETKTVRALVAGGKGPALGQPGRPDLDYAGLTATIDAAGRALARPRHPPRRARRHRAPERPRNGGGLPRSRLPRRRRAPEPGLHRRRIRLLHGGPRRQAPPRPPGQRHPRPRRRRALRHPRRRSRPGRSRRQLHARRRPRRHPHLQRRKRRGPCPPHLGHDLAAQDRAAHLEERHDLGPQHRGHAAPEARRPLPQRHAALPHPRPDRGGPVVHVRGRRHLLRARFRRAQVLRPARGGEPHLVHRRPHDASGDPAARQAQRRHHRQGAAPLHPLLLGLPPGPRPPRTRGNLRLPCDRGLRDDRSLPPDGVEPAPSRQAQARLGRHGRGPRGRDHGRRRRDPPPRPASARSSSGATTSPPATRTTPRPTPTTGRTAGSAPATRARWTRTAS